MIAWIGVIGTLIGALVGGGLALLNARVQLHHHMVRERNKLILSKLEELYENITHLRKSRAADIVQVNANFIDVNPALDLAKDIPKLVDAIEKIEMLVGFYAPELVDYLEKMNMREAAYGSAFIKCMKFTRKDAEPKMEFVALLNTAWKELDQAYSKMQAQIIKESRKYI
jgi:hypothetical protein